MIKLIWKHPTIEFSHGHKLVLVPNYYKQKINHVQEFQRKISYNNPNSNKTTSGIYSEPTPSGGVIRLTSECDRTVRVSEWVRKSGEWVGGDGDTTMTMWRWIWI